jgi:C_GCAxxG_C_C family probable redox protein
MMATKTDPVNTAVETFNRSYNCAQSVFSAFAPQFGVSAEAAQRIGSTFGAGVARRGEICGAVTGALMALGLGRGAADPSGKEEAYRLGQEFLQRFEAKYGTTLCRELIDCDISTPAGRQDARQKGAFTALCPLFVRDAAEIAQSMLKPG